MSELGHSQSYELEEPTASRGRPCQHYKSGSAHSTLAGAIENNCILWNLIGYSSGVADTGKWMKDNLDRDDFFIAPHSEQGKIIKVLEVYLRARLGPMYEGSLS